MGVPPEARAIAVALGLALALAAPGACAHGPDAPFEPPLPATEGWVTTRTAHFVVHTDAGAGTIRLSAARFEETYTALATAIFGRPLDRPVEALVFHDVGEYRDLNGNNAGRFISGLGRTGSVLVARNSEDDQYLGRILAHELAHRFVRDNYPTVPNWLSEGIASFVETADVRREEVVFGAAPREGSHVTFHPGGVSFSELVAVSPSKLYGGEAPFFYAAAWALVHYLIAGDEGRMRTRFPELLRRMNQAAGDGRLARAAFAEVYPEKTEADFDTAMVRNTRRLGHSFPDTVVVFPQSPVSPAAATSGPADPGYLAELFTGLRKRRQVVAEGPALTERPRYVRAELGFASLERNYLGLAGGRMLSPSLAVELQVGAGPLGLELAPVGRYLFPLGEGGNFFGLVGVGPVLGLKSAMLGNLREGESNVPVGARELFHYLGLQPELGCEIHTPAGIVLRVAASAYLELHENLSPLCQPLAPGGVACANQRPRTGPQIGRDGFALAGRLAAGWTW
jgi:hypothetical protein